MGERAVPRLIAFHQARQPHLLHQPAGQVLAALASADADLLGGDADVCIATAADFGSEVAPAGIGVLTGGNVEPLDENGAVELVVGAWPTDQDSGTKCRRLVGLDGPVP